MTKRVPITVTYGDGIGPEIMSAALKILQAGGAKLDIETIEIGEKIYLAGNSSGIEQKSWESLRRTGIFYKAPLTTPLGSGFKSVNVTIRKTLGLFSNVRPVMSYHPFVRTLHPKVDIVMIRENEEDLYAGIEHRQTDEVYQTLKLISRPGSERIVRYAFEYARRHGRKKVTCFTKDNIMKMTDGLFHKVFDQVGEEYPEIERQHLIIDIGTARAATEPENFDVIVMPNLYGDVVSDVVAQLTGSVGLAGSANIGEHFAMFEAIHGSAPDIAGKGIANPSGLLLAGVMMLAHLAQGEAAARIHNAWLKTIEDGIHTGDIYSEGISKQRVGTEAFTEAVIERLGQSPEKFPVAAYSTADTLMQINFDRSRKTQRKELVGIDLFLDWHEEGRDASKLADALHKITDEHLKLIMITNRGQKVWPSDFTDTFCTDHWRCRFHSSGELPIKYHDVLDLMRRATDAGFDIIKTENLYMFDGERGYSLGQGQ
ncbi:MAG TPA: NADP-dependent isocitrate dehydrogenase [Aggregatilineales bacterium]|nr:NADP-dependent isocitrate dehydrogenase [Aggregatilineales bacterium]